MTASDFNAKLREKGESDVSVQKVCRLSKNEAEVREVLDALWKTPAEAASIVESLAKKNEDLYNFEKMLAEGGTQKHEPLEEDPT